MSKTKVVRITGTLARDGRGGFQVPLTASVVELWDNGRIAEAEVSHVELASSNVPDADYTLEYFYMRPYREAVRVQGGVLVAR
jgi:hypothetical protein